jgi:hypothetical protein
LKKKFSKKIIFEQLEPRLLFSADLECGGQRKSEAGGGRKV